MDTCKVMCFKRVLLIVIAGWLLGLAGPIVAQQTTVYTHDSRLYSEAMDLFQKEKYGAAQKTFIQVLKLPNAVQSNNHVDAEFYAALCGLKLFSGEFYESLRRKSG